MLPSEEEAHAIKTLRKLLRPRDTVYCILTHRAASGMSRSISLVVGRGREVEDITYWVARVMDRKIDQKHGGIRTHGCGMDMGFDLVYNLGRCLWPKGTRKPHGTRNGEPDSCGGYALKSRWL